MHPRNNKAFTCLMVFLSLLSIVGIAFGWDYYPTSYRWDFQNYSYLGFNQAMNFTDAPNKGVPYDRSLVGYWNLNEGSGAVAYDSTGNGNNGTLTGASWVDGKYGKALTFDGASNKVDCGNNASLRVQNLTVSFWFNSVNSTTDERAIVDKGWANGFACGHQTSKLYFLGRKADTSAEQLYGLTNLTAGWNFYTATYNGIILTLYLNGAYDNSDNVSLVFNHAANLLIGKNAGGGYYEGIVDDVRVFNRSLTAVEIAALYTLNPYSQPDPVSFANYYNFTDPVTNNTMLIHVDNANANSNNVAVVTCTNFFTDDRLAFQANNSATVNVWTNLGQSAFTTDFCVWNSQNFTTTLTLNASSTAELSWHSYSITTYTDAHSNVSPSNATVVYGRNQTFNFSATQGYRLIVTVDGASQGQISSYTFNNVTAQHTVTVTSTQLFTIKASADSGGSITPSGSVVVDYGQTQKFNFTANTGYHISNVIVDNASQGVPVDYTFNNIQANHTIAVTFSVNIYNITTSTDQHSTITPGNMSIKHGENQQFKITTESGYIISHVYVDGVDKGNLTSYNFTDIQGNHTITVTSESTNISTPNSSTSPTSSPETSQTPQTTSSPLPSSLPSPSPSPTQQPAETTQTNPFPTQTVIIAVIVIAIIIAIAVIAHKKGYVTIEIVKENPYDETLDY